MAWENNAPNHVHPRVRNKILKRDKRICQWCGRPGSEVDHIDNSRGPGYDDEANMQTLCSPCHKQKTQKEAQQGRAARRAKLKRAPLPHPGLVYNAGE